MSPIKKFRASLAFLVSTAFAGLLLIFALFLWSYKVRLFQGNFLDRSKGKATLLKNLVVAKPKAEERVLIAGAISQMVERSRKESSDIYIREAFFLSAKGNVIAHSNAIRMSVEMQADYKTPKYQKVLSQSKQDPILVRPLKHRETSFGPFIKYWKDSHPPMGHMLSYLFVEEIASEYSIGVACYSPKPLQAIGSFHIVTEVDIANSLLSPWNYYQVHNLYLIIFLALLIACFLFVGHYSSAPLGYRFSSQKAFPQPTMLSPPNYGAASPVFPLPSPQAHHAPPMYYPPAPYPPSAYSPPPPAHHPFTYPSMPTAEAIPLKE